MTTTTTGPSTRRPTATVAAFLKERRASLSEAELVEGLRELLGPTDPPSAVTPLSAHDQEYLRTHGGIPEVSTAELERWRAQQIANASAFVVESLTTAEVAERMGVHASRVRHLTSEGALYAMRIGRQNRYPLWQFLDNGQPLPGLRVVLDLLPPGLHPLSVRGFMITPQPEYEVRGRELTPIEWLAAGGDAEEVALFAAALGQDH